MLKDFENVQQDLKMLHDKLVQIEKEKDREMRLLKQKELVDIVQHVCHVFLDVL